MAPVHLARQWLAELNKTLPWLTGHIITKGQPYDVSGRRDMKGRQPDLLVISYAKLAGWADHLAGDIRTVIFDEVHELRTGAGTAKWAAAAQIAWKATYRIGLSATPIANYGGEAWNILRVLDPDVLGSETEFIREWCGVANGMGRHNSLRDPAEFGHYLRDTGVMLRRTRTDLHRELPEPIQVEQPVDTNHASIDEVAAQCEQQARILVGEIDADYTARGRAALEIDWRMRQVTGVAKGPAVAEFIKLILASEQRVVVWAWHREVYDILVDALADYHPVLYTGTESPAAKAANAAAFCGGESRVLLMSLRSGAGLDGLQEWCSVGVFAELDWSPAVHAQCVGRLNRDGQDRTVMAYFMTSDDGTDPLMCEVLGIKRQQSEPVINPDAALFTTLTPQTDRARQLSAEVLARLARTTRRRRLWAPGDAGDEVWRENVTYAWQYGGGGSLGSVGPECSSPGRSRPSLAIAGTETPQAESAQPGPGVGRHPPHVGGHEQGPRPGQAEDPYWQPVRVLQPPPCLLECLRQTGVTVCAGEQWAARVAGPALPPLLTPPRRQLAFHLISVIHMFDVIKSLHAVPAGERLVTWARKGIGDSGGGDARSVGLPREARRGIGGAAACKRG